MMRLRQPIGRIGTAWAAIIAVIVAFTAATSWSAAPVAADPTCEVRDATGKCVIWGEDDGDNDEDDETGNDDPDPPPDGQTIDPEAVCAEEAPGWGDCVTVVSATGLRPSQICGYVYHPDQSALHYYEPDAPDDAVLVYWICPRDGGPYYTEQTDWVPADEAAPPPSPAEVAARAYAELEVSAPELAADPGCEPAGPGEPWSCVRQLVQVPTFVEVTNWQGEFSVDRCEGPVCVSLSAVPSLSLDPGEPGAGTVDCAPPGSRFDEAEGDPQAQAEAAGACAHIYTQDSESNASGGWLGEVTVTWQVSWAQTDSGGSDSGEFEPFSLSTEFLRPIYEVQSLVTDADLD